MKENNDIKIILAKLNHIFTVGGGFDMGADDMNPEPVEPPSKKVKNLYESFVAARDREERGLPSESGESLSSLKTGDKPRQGGNTVYVFGYQITEDLLRNAFMPLGKIVNISMEVEKVGTFNPSSQIEYSSFSQVQNESFLTDDLPQNHDIYHDIAHT